MANIKLESGKHMNLTGRSVEDCILDVLRNNPNGCSQERLDRALGQIISQQESANALNYLLVMGRVQLFRADVSSLMYKEVTIKDASRVRNLGTQEALVLQVIRKAGSNGIWTRDIKEQANLTQVVIQRIVRALENRSLVKRIRSVEHPARKVYVPSEVEPSREVAGGAWYTNAQLDDEFVRILREECFKHIKQQGDTTLRKAAAFIKSSRISNVDLTEDDILTIINTLVADGRVDQVEVDGDGAGGTDDHYRPAMQSIPRTTALTSIPCGVCPVFRECHEGGSISPQTCVYFDKYLDF